MATKKKSGAGRVIFIIIFTSLTIICDLNFLIKQIVLDNFVFSSAVVLLYIEDWKYEISNAIWSSIKKYYKTSGARDNIFM